MNERIARLRIELQDIEPKIWRRVDVPCSSTLGDLHYIIQISFGWTNSHMHDFIIGERVYTGLSPFDDGSDREALDENSMRIKTLVGRRLKKFLYRYDFGDDWRHDIFIEKVRESEDTVGYPAFVDGARRGPPDDVGGPWGFMDFLEAVLDPKHEEHEAMIEWYGGSYDPDDIDERSIRKRLRYFAANSGKAKG